MRGRRRYSLAALAAHLRVEPTHKQLQRAIGLSGTTLKLAMCHGLGREQAERYAIRAGLHPYEVWPEMATDDYVDAMIACEECGELFVKRQGGGRPQRFCSHNCAVRNGWRRRYHASEAFRQAEIARSRTYYRDNARIMRAKQAARRKRAKE